MLYKPTTLLPQADSNKLRHYCRNPKCRGKLESPVENERIAFCTRGCYASFYRHRCLVCEGPIARAVENQKICKKAKCRNALRARSGLGRFFESTAVSSAVKPTQKVPDFIGLESASGGGRARRQVAGPNLAPRSFHAAIVPDGPGCQWKGGALERIEAKNRALLKAHFAELAKNCVFQRDTPPVNLLGGYKFPGAPTAAELGLAAPAAIRSSGAIVAETARLIATISADLSIPGFLKRPELTRG